MMVRAQWTGLSVVTARAEEICSVIMVEGQAGWRWDVSGAGTLHAAALGRSQQSSKWAMCALPALNSRIGSGASAGPPIQMWSVL